MTAETTSLWRWISLLVALAGNLVGALVASIVETVRWLIAIVRPELTPTRPPRGPGGTHAR